MLWSLYPGPNMDPADPLTQLRREGSIESCLGLVRTCFRVRRDL